MLERLIPEDDAASFLNRRSPAYKDRNLAARALTKRQVIDLMLEEPNLIRRPLVVRGATAVFGYSEDDFEGLV